MLRHRSLNESINIVFIYNILERNHEDRILHIISIPIVVNNIIITCNLH